MHESPFQYEWVKVKYRRVHGVENIRKYRDNIKVETTHIEKKEIDKGPKQRSNVRPQDRKPKQ